nr:hypothetical protein [Candidatus Sigynarchaeota archaeon]
MDRSSINRTKRLVLLASLVLVYLVGSTPGVSGYFNLCGVVVGQRLVYHSTRQNLTDTIYDKYVGYDIIAIQDRLVGGDNLTYIYASAYNVTANVYLQNSSTLFDAASLYVLNTTLGILNETTNLVYSSIIREDVKIGDMAALILAGLNPANNYTVTPIEDGYGILMDSRVLSANTTAIFSCHGVRTLLRTILPPDTTEMTLVSGDRTCASVPGVPGAPEMFLLSAIGGAVAFLVIIEYRKRRLEM